MPLANLSGHLFSSVRECIGHRHFDTFKRQGATDFSADSTASTSHYSYAVFKSFGHIAFLVSTVTRQEGSFRRLARISLAASTVPV